MKSFDSELTGLDLWHGCLPYSFQMCYEDGTLLYWEWDVDPFTRIPAIKYEDLYEIETLKNDNENDDGRTLTHNAKIDIRAFDKACDHFNRINKNLLQWKPRWNWELIECSLIKSHALRNLWSHSLKDLRDEFLHIPRTNQDRLKQAVNLARNICRSPQFIEKHGNWRIAEEEDKHWPGIIRAPNEKEEDIEGWWLFDGWLPKAIWTLAPDFLPLQETRISYGEHPFRTVSKVYALEDAETTLAMHELLDEALASEGLTEASQKRHKLLRIFYQMENTGVSISEKKTISERARYDHESSESAVRITQIAANNGLDDFNPASGKQLISLLFDNWKLPILEMTEPSKTHPNGQPRTSAEVIEKLAAFIEESGNSTPHIKPRIREIQEFLDAYVWRKRNEKASDRLDSLLRWSVNHGPGNGRRIHSNANITGTRFTRQSFSNPSLQNESTGKDVEDDEGDKYTEFLTRVVYGPRSGKQWLSIDFQSIEFFIWGFSCGNEEIKRVYEAGLSPFKPVMEAVWGFFDKEDKRYKKTKNGIYSVLYGARESHSDKTFGRDGAVKSVIDRLPEVKTFTKRLHRQITNKGYITTIGGYRLYVESDEPHKAVSAYVQGHAGWVIGEAMQKCFNYLQDFPEVQIILQIHDELIFEGPEGFHEQHAEPLGNLMREAGEQYGIPTPINKKLILNNWGEEIAL